jgi:hypothetical protein
VQRVYVKLFVVVALALAVGLAFGASPYASRSPDGLEKVAQSKRFLQSETPHRIQAKSPIPGYAFPGIDDPRLATGLAGFVGTLGVTALAIGIGVLVRRRAATAGRPAA